MTGPKERPTRSRPATLGGGGTLQLVSPNIVDFGALGTLPALMTLTITFTPEPATAMLLGAALAALAVIQRRAH